MLLPIASSLPPRCVAAILLLSSSASATVELALDAGYRRLGDATAVSSDGLRVVELEVTAASLQRFVDDCAALPTARGAPDAALSRWAAPGRLGRRGRWCAMVVHRRADERMLAVSVAWPRAAAAGGLPTDQRVELSVVFDGDPDAWKPQDVIAEMKRLAQKVSDGGGDDVALAIAPWEGDRLPALPMACELGVVLPRGWRKVDAPADAPDALVLREDGGHAREVRLVALPRMLAAPSLRALASTVPNTRTWKTPSGQLHFRWVAEGEQAHTLFEPLPCGSQVSMLVVVGPADRDAGQWSATGISRLLGASIKPAGEADFRRLAGERAHPPAGGSTPKETALARRWVQQLAGSDGRHFDSRSADRSGGRASDGYAVADSQSVLRLCADGTFLAHTHAETYVSTPYGDASHVSDDRLQGRWGVFVLGGTPTLYLWSDKGVKQVPLVRGGRDVSLIALAGGTYDLRQMRPGGCASAPRR